LRPGIAWILSSLGLSWRSSRRAAWSPAHRALRQRG